MQGSRSEAVRASVRAWLAVAMAGVVVALAGCARPAPEQALRRSLDELQRSIQERDAAALRGHLAEDFIGPGGMDRDQVRRTAALYMMRYRSVGLVMGPREVEMGESHATVRFRAALSGGSGPVLPDSANVYRVETGWRLQDGEWRITSAHWTPVL